MKRKAIIGLALAFIAIFAMVVAATWPEDPIQVSGNLSKHEVAAIRAAVRRAMFPRILPDLSRQSLRAAPGRIRDRFRKPKVTIWHMEARTHEFVVVLGRSPQDKSKPTAFWGAFRGTNSWRVIRYY